MKTPQDILQGCLTYSINAAIEKNDLPGIAEKIKAYTHSSLHISAKHINTSNIESIVAALLETPSITHLKISSLKHLAPEVFRLLLTPLKGKLYMDFEREEIIITPPHVPNA